MGPWDPQRVHHFIFFLLILFSGFGCRAETQEGNPQVAPPQIPMPLEKISDFFQSFQQKGFARTSIEFPAYSFYLGAPALNGVAYVPDFSPRLGLQVGWEDYSVSTSFALPLPENEVYRRGSTDQLSFIFSKHWRQWGLDMYYQRYKGFYLSSPFTELDVNKPTRYPQLPDAQTSNYGISVYYTMDPDHYSLAAAFSQSEFQTATGGSWLLHPFYNHVELTTGTIFVKGSDANSQQSMPDLRSATLDTFGMGLGYGHTWIKDRRFISAEGAIGPGLQFQQIEYSGYDRSSGTNLAAQINVNVAAGWNQDVYTWGARALAHSLLSNVKGEQIDSTLIQGQIFFGGRF